MKRIVCLLLVILFVCFSACENSDSIDSLDSTNMNTASESNVTNKTGETKTEEQNGENLDTNSATSQATSSYNNNTQNSVEPSKVSVWDGKSTEKWTKGTGKLGDPYLIESAAQLAFLAECSTWDDEYISKHFLQTVDIDLKNHPWTPIGTMDHAFCGVFDGGNFVISNISLKKGEGHVTTEKGTVYECLGLFGYTKNSTISNVHVSGVQLDMTFNSYSPNVFYIGGIVGHMQCDSVSVMKHCFVDNASFLIKSKTKGKVYLGGIFGYSETEENAIQKLSRLSSDISARVYVYGTNHIGGIAGYVYQKGETEFSDICSNLVILKSEQYKGLYNISPLMGVFNAYNGVLQLTSCYLSLNSNYYEFNLRNHTTGHESNTNGCVGEHYGYYEGKANAQNVFCTFTAGNSYIMNYSLFHLTCEEGVRQITNCFGVEVLPETCGFDKNIWDLNDMSQPKLK